MILFYLFSLLSLLIGLGAIFTLVEKFPLKLLYYHYHFRKPLIWAIFLSAVGFFVFRSMEEVPWGAIPAVLLVGLSVILTYKAHQSNWFKAVDFPEMTDDLEALPLNEESEMALIEYEGVSKAYPLDYVIHHHIVNDRFGDKIVALTYCAMCHSIIPFDVTEIGPLFVASFKNANMIVADRKTGTFFQQATFESAIGKLHPHTLEMIPFQILPWKNVKNLEKQPKVASVTEKDLAPFSLPIPGVWKKVMGSELTPGLSQKDETLPSKTRIIGILDANFPDSLCYLKSEILEMGLVQNRDLSFVLLALGQTVIGFKIKDFDLELKEDSLRDKRSCAEWNFTGRCILGPGGQDLVKLGISDEYWFSWKKFHAESRLVRLRND